MNMWTMPAEIRWRGLGSEETIWAAAGVLRAWIRNTVFRWRCIRIGRTCTFEKRAGKNSCRGCAGDAIWSDVPTAGDWHHRGQLAGGKRPSRKKSRHHQDRLVKKNAPEEKSRPMRRRTYFWRRKFAEHNRRFRRIPAQPEDYHRRLRGAELEEDFSFGTGRVSVILGGAA